MLLIKIIKPYLCAPTQHSKCGRRVDLQDDKDRHDIDNPVISAAYGEAYATVRTFNLS